MSMGKKDQSAIEAVDRGFHNRARGQLQKLGITATEFLRQHPDCSKVQLAQIINHGVTARGLTIQLFEEAQQQNAVKVLAQELLYREILEEFPEGWFEDPEVRATVKISRWRSDVLEFAPEFREQATAIIKALATTNKPKQGWRPTSADDEEIRFLFDRYWT